MRNEEIQKRLRAARGYADLTQPELAKLLGIGESTYKRYEAGNLPVGFAFDGLVWAVARATKLPRAFFTIDLAQLNRLAEDSVDIDGLLEERLTALEELANTGAWPAEAPTQPPSDPTDELETELDDASPASEPQDDDSEQDEPAQGSEDL